MIFKGNIKERAQIKGGNPLYIHSSVAFTGVFKSWTFFSCYFQPIFFELPSGSMESIFCLVPKHAGLLTDFCLVSVKAQK